MFYVYISYKLSDFNYGIETRKEDCEFSLVSKMFYIYMFIFTFVEYSL